MTPETRYARSGEVSIAYQVIGGGTRDLVFVPGIISHVEFFHELPGYSEFLDALAAFARVIVFDKTGNGLSDRVAGAPTLEQRMDDIRAVALCAPTMLYDDRRRSVLLTGGRDMFLASSRITMGARDVPTLLATAGDRLTLSHLRWSDPAGKKWDLEMLSIHEVDAEGRTVAVISFDRDERRAAAMEMLERFSRSEEARFIPPAAFEGLRAVNAHDVDRLRAVLADDFVMDDHRRTGLGRLNRETYLASLAALFEEAADMTTEILRVIAVEKHGSFVLARNFGTLREGGAFESVYLRIWVYQGDLTGRVEMFEPEDLDIARARFEELCAERARHIPP